MPQVPLPPGVKETAAAIWLGVKATFPESCLAAADEKFNFAKGNKPKGENVEMTAVGNAQEGVVGGEGSAGMPREDGMLRRRGESFGSSSTVGVEGGDHDMITEWQAGWNVTNAIQVLKSFK